MGGQSHKRCEQPFGACAEFKKLVYQSTFTKRRWLMSFVNCFKRVDQCLLHRRAIAARVGLANHTSLPAPGPIRAAPRPRARPTPSPEGPLHPHAHRFRQGVVCRGGACRRCPAQPVHIGRQGVLRSSRCGRRHRPAAVHGRAEQNWVAGSGHSPPPGPANPASWRVSPAERCPGPLADG